MAKVTSKLQITLPFTVLNSSSDGCSAECGVRRAQRPDLAAKPVADIAVYGRTGFNPDRAFVPVEVVAGVPAVVIPELGRVELQVPGAKHVALLANGEVRAAPVGMSVDEAAGMVRWSVGPGYLGTYRLSIEREDDQVLVDLTVVADGAGGRAGADAPGSGGPVWGGVCAARLGAGPAGGYGVGDWRGARVGAVAKCGVRRAQVQILREHGYDAASVIEQGMGGWKDPQLWIAIQSEERFLVTADKGFGDIHTYPPGKHFGTVTVATPRGIRMRRE